MIVKYTRVNQPNKELETPSRHDFAKNKLEEV